MSGPPVSGKISFPSKAASGPVIVASWRASSRASGKTPPSCPGPGWLPVSPPGSPSLSPRAASVDPSCAASAMGPLSREGSASVSSASLEHAGSSAASAQTTRR